MNDKDICALFLAYCEKRRDLATDAAARGHMWQYCQLPHFKRMPTVA